MFKLRVDDTFDWPVKFTVPEGGKHKQVSFNATFKRLPREEMSDLNPVANETTDEASARLARFLNVACVSVELEIIGRDSVPLSDPEEKKRICIADSTISSAMLAAFVEAMSGERIRKN